MLQTRQNAVWRHAQVLCGEIGPRLSGTPADDRAVEYIAAHMRRCGLETEIQDYRCPAWECGATELALLRGGHRVALPAVGQTFSPACDVEAELAWVGSLPELDLAPDLESKALVVHGELASSLNTDRNPALLAAEERRAAALIVVSPAETVPTKLIRDPFAQVPSVAVAQSVGEMLLSGGGGRVALRMEAHRYDSTGHNVIARMAGNADRHVVVAAHYDTAAMVPGAVDNASGTAVLLELCERFGALPRRELGIHFVAYGSEEYGRRGGACLGAAEYVRRHPGDVAGTQAVIEVDCVGTVGIPPTAILMGLPEALREGLRDMLGAFPCCNVRLRPGTEPSVTPFNVTGLPTVWFVNDYPRLPIHTAQDTLELLGPAEMATAVEMAAAVLEHLTSGRDITPPL